MLESQQTLEIPIDIPILRGDQRMELQRITSEPEKLFTRRAAYKPSDFLIIAQYLIKTDFSPYPTSNDVRQIRDTVAVFKHESPLTGLYRQHPGLDTGVIIKYLEKQAAIPFSSLPEPIRPHIKDEQWAAQLVSTGTLEEKRMVLYVAGLINGSSVLSNNRKIFTEVWNQNVVPFFPHDEQPYLTISEYQLDQVHIALTALETTQH